MGRLATMYGAGSGRATFLGLPAAGPDGARATILGADTATPYPSVGPYCAGGPAAIRAASQDWAGTAGHVNFDLHRAEAPDMPARACAPDVADGGDLAVGTGDAAADRAAIREAVGAVARGGVPVLLGGDDSVQIPMLEAMSEAAGGPLHVLQIDAHIDWRDEVEGERWGLSSVMRRASEMAGVAGMLQVGQRGLGSARGADLADALGWGAVMVPAREVRREGVARAVAAIPQGARVAVCLDLDALDPAVMPCVIARTPGGLSHWDVVELVEGVAARAEIVSLGVVEMMPTRDVDGQGASAAAMLVASLLGLIAPG